MAETSSSKEPQLIDATIVRTHGSGTRTRGLWAGVAALVLVGIVAGVYYLTMRAVHAHARQTQAALAELRSRLDSLGRSVEEGSANANQAAANIQQEIERRLREADEKQAALANEVKQSLSALSQAQPRTETDWVLHEVQYLLTVGEQRLRLEHDVQTAAAALESADRRLADSEDPTLLPIREQLIADLNALRAVPPIDIAGMTLNLADLLDHVDALPLKGGDVEPTGVESTAGADPEAMALNESGWRQALRRMWKDLVSLVDIKSMNIPDEVIFDPGKRYLLQQNLRLELASARLEVLRRDTANLRATLQRIDRLLDRYYDTRAPQVASARERLAQMMKVELAPSLPSLERSLERVRAQLQPAPVLVEPGPG